MLVDLYGGLKQTKIKRMSKERMRDIAYSLELIVHREDSSDIELYVYRTILDAIEQHHNGCVCTIIPKDTITMLEYLGFQVEEEIEEDNRYWIVSWQQEVII